MKKVIYDFGANNGINIPYYLKKADLVVAVEANPALCEQMHARFSREVSEKRLVIENCVLTDKVSSGNIVFYLHKTDHVLSQLPAPKDPHNFNEVTLPSKTAPEIVFEYGEPHYIKIDIEHFAHVILRSLFENQIRPAFISVESHDIEVFSLLVSLGRYNAFRLVDGSSVEKVYSNYAIETNWDGESYSFPLHSAGPFGKDLRGEWMTANNFFRLLAFVGLGWRDIHATSEIAPNSSLIAEIKPNFEIVLRNPGR